jgi:cysteine desulfurase/selenocysteine lyase
MSAAISQCRDDFPILSRTVHRKRPLVFLDNAASTQRPTQVIEAMSRFYEHDYANVHRGVHALSEKASDRFEAARESVAQFIGAEFSKEIVFTSGTTMSINLVARALGELDLNAGDEILLTELEHHSNIVPWQQLAARTGCRVRFLPVNDHGVLAIDRLAEFLGPQTKVFSLSALSNVLGTMMPVAKLVEQAKEVGAWVLVDAAQHTPHSPTDVKAWGADFVVFSGHKMLGPTGIGVLWGRYDALQQLPPFLGGGSMIDTVTTEGFRPSVPPAKFEAGTPPIAEAIGLAAAIDYLNSVGIGEIESHERKLTELACAGIQEIPRVRLLGPQADRAGILSFVVEGMNAQDVSTFLDLKGVATRAGHHCAMPLHQRFGVLSSCRASFYLYNTEQEVEFFLESLQDVIEKLS